MGLGRRRGVGELNYLAGARNAARLSVIDGAKHDAELRFK